MESESTGAKTFTFAGVTSKLTKSGMIRRPALLKMLRSGRVKIVTRYKMSDDYAMDAYTNCQNGVERCPIEMANDIEESPTGWRSSPNQKGSVELYCYTFMSFTLVEVPFVKPSPDIESKAKAAIAKRCEEGERALAEARTERVQRAKAAQEEAERIQKEDAIRSAQNAAHRLTKQMRIAAIEAELMRKEGKFFN